MATVQIPSRKRKERASGKEGYKTFAEQMPASFWTAIYELRELGAKGKVKLDGEEVEITNGLVMAYGVNQLLANRKNGSINIRTKKASTPKKKAVAKPSQ